MVQQIHDIIPHVLVSCVVRQDSNVSPSVKWKGIDLH